MIPEERLMTRVILQHILDYFKNHKKIEFYLNIDEIVTTTFNEVKEHYKKKGVVIKARRLRSLLSKRKEKEDRLRYYRRERKNLRNWALKQQGSFNVCAMAWNKTPEVLTELVSVKMNDIDKGGVYKE